MTEPAIEIRRLDGRQGLRDWLNVPQRVYADDAAYVPQLRLSEKQRISASHNPFFLQGEAAFFIAYRAGAPVGRISAQVDRAHLERHKDRTGLFGFFDCIEDVTVARALVEAAAQWLAERGMICMRGPFGLAINQEAGLLVAGFEQPPALMMGHAPRWADRLMRECGLAKEMDLHAYRMSPREWPARIDRLADLARGSDRVRIRRLEMHRYGEEVGLVFDIFNDAWSDNWGFVPVREPEVAAIAKQMRPIIRGKFGLIAEIDGSPAAMLVVLPDLNRIIEPFGGRLLPFNWARLARAIYEDRWKTARIVLLGIRKGYRKSPQATAVLSLLVAEILALGRNYDLDWVEFSWVLETNREMVALAQLAAGPPAKVYRIYGMDITSGSTA